MFLSLIIFPDNNIIIFIAIIIIIIIIIMIMGVNDLPKCTTNNTRVMYMALDFSLRWSIFSRGFIFELAQFFVRDLLKDTHRWREILVYLFSFPKNPSRIHLSFFCIKQIEIIFS